MDVAPAQLENLRRTGRLRATYLFLDGVGHAPLLTRDEGRALVAARRFAFGESLRVAAVIDVVVDEGR